MSLQSVGWRIALRIPIQRLGGRGFVLPFVRLAQPRWQTFVRASAPLSRRRHDRAIATWARQYSTSNVEPYRPLIPDITSVLGACPGCGGLAQSVEVGIPGYYAPNRRAIRKYVGDGAPQQAAEDATSTEEINIVEKALAAADPAILETLNLNQPNPDMHNLGQSTAAAPAKNVPLCDRCHLLLHHHQGESIDNPSLQSIHDTINDSPYKYNHIYHVLDASDFPMSLVPRIHEFLEVAPQRSRNRRSKHAGFHHGRKTELSFIITRSDLLARTKDQVDRLMPYLVKVLRNALGYAGRDVRLGNVRCVSAKRGWWTRELKADIWRRGGGGWLVGKVNVGKSNLFEVAFPKGEAEDINFDKIRNQARCTRPDPRDGPRLDDPDGYVPGELDRISIKQAQESFTDLLPPARAETAYPIMPTVSSLPGTTSSPIRIPFGGGKGELIDLPGLDRGTLASFVQAEARTDLMMKSRISPEQYVITSGKTLVLGGLFRFEAVDSGVTLLAYPFVPLASHLTSIAKAAEMTTGQRRSVKSTVSDEGSAKMASAGVFKLQWDVTKLRAGPLTRPSAVGLKASNLPFQVFSADILLEGVGWVELVAQVRRQSRARAGPDVSERPFDTVAVVDPDVTYPEVQVFSPEGKFVGVREPMNAWMLGEHGARTKAARKSRPRRAMAGSKKQAASRTMLS